MKSADSIRLGFDELKVFCEHVFAAFGFSEEDSRTVTDVLLAADLAGITSHGVQRLVRYHKEINELGYVDMKSTPEIMRETLVSAVVDAHNGMGQVVSVKAMNLAIDKAKKSGIGMVPVRNSNHFGIAGYYARMAVSQGLIGVAMTNSEAIMVPTFGKKAMLGTNPIAFAMPAKPFPFVFDSATTVVPRGKLEVVVKRDGVIPEGWAVDERGLPCTDAARVLGNIINKAGGGILPLGGAGEDTSGHKGYGFGMICEIMTAVLSGGAPDFPAINASVPNICANTYPGWYGCGGKSTMKAVVDDYFARNKLTTIALSEYGAGGSVNQHQNPVAKAKCNSRFHPEEWQTKVHMDDLRHIIGEDRIWGSFAWVMFDYASDERREGDHSGVNDKGLVTRDRVTLKDAFYLYKANWNPAPMLHLCGKRMKRKSASDGAAEIDVVAFSNVGDVTLTVNGKVVGRAKPDEIRSVTFKAVSLKAGVNTIVVEAGGLRDGMEFTISGAAMAATPAATSGGAGKYDVAAYVWPAYQSEPRWAELGIFDAGKGEWQNVWEAVPKWE